MSDLQERVILTDPATRALQMRQHVEAVAQSILSDHRGDSLFEQALNSHRHVHGYSLRNRLLMQWQAPLSRMVAALGAYERMAADQGAETINIKGRPCRVMIRTGARGVWIWGRTSRRRQFHDSITDEERTEVAVSYIPVTTWAVEDIVYAASGEAFVLPDHVAEVDDTRLYRRLLEFAAARDITVEHRGLLGPRGVSSGGRITLQHGDSESVQLTILAHEVMHELLHHAPDSRHLPKPVVEGEAETGMAVIMKHFGHDAVTSPQYLRNHGVQPKDVLNSMDRILRAAGQVIEFIEGREAAA